MESWYSQIHPDQGITIFTLNPTFKRSWEEQKNLLLLLLFYKLQMIPTLWICHYYWLNRFRIKFKNKWYVLTLLRAVPNTTIHPQPPSGGTSLTTVFVACGDIRELLPVIIIKDFFLLILIAEIILLEPLLYFLVSVTKLIFLSQSIQKYINKINK